MSCLMCMFSVMSHVNGHSKDRINESSGVHVLLCRLFMLAHVLLIVFL